jgi:hypothetical protein
VIEDLWDQAAREAKAGLVSDISILEIPGLEEPLEALRKIFGDGRQLLNPAADASAPHGDEPLPAVAPVPSQAAGSAAGASVQPFAQQHRPEPVGLLRAFRDGQLVSDEDMEAVRDLLGAAIPSDSMLCDLRDLGVHFEDGEYLTDEWVRSAAFGDDDPVAWCAEALAELFLQKCDEYALDYDQHRDPAGFAERIQDTAEAFIADWRARLRAAHPSLIEIGEPAQSSGIPGSDLPGDEQPKGEGTPQSLSGPAGAR